MAGFEVRTAADGQEAVAICCQETFDAVLSDVRMPGMNGHQLAQWVATNYPQTHTVLMSGFDVACEYCHLAPTCVLLPKPFRPHEAVALMQNVLVSG